MPGVDHDQLSATNDGATVKRCMPFLDAMTTGWIIPLAATVRLEIGDGGKARRGRVGVRPADRQQSRRVPGRGNPYEPRPPMKVHNYWTVRTAPGWSCLFVPPLNRPHDVVTVLSGIVDTDTFPTRVNFPFVAIAADGVHVVPKGTPLVQVIPFRRADAAFGATVSAESAGERGARRRTHRVIASGGGWYRRHARQART